MVVLEDFSKDYQKFHLTGRKNQLLKELAGTLGDAELLKVAKELKKVVKELEEL